MSQPHKQISEEQKKIKSEDTNLLEMQFLTIASCGVSSGFLFLLTLVLNQKTLRECKLLHLHSMRNTL